ncbi:hypothetical protein ACFU9X_40845 [Streptomyces atratus]|uniref:hypothetical protein n=1 Tax=Streptomyces atratus TaxID=1893 RepID=UPI0036BA01DF
MTDTTARPADAWPGAVDGGCCAACPIRPGCALAAETYVVCPITGTTPPTAPPPRVPAQHTGEDLAEDFAEETTVTAVDGAGVEQAGPDWADVAGRTAEGVAAAALGVGWIDIATGLIERFNREDADGNPVDWGRLQLKRNALAVIAVTVPPLGEHTAAQWVAHVLSTNTLTDAAFLPAGIAFGLIVPVFAGQIVPGVFGEICKVLSKVLVLTGKAVWTAVWKFVTSGLGWIVTRPLIWAVPCGLIILTGRYFLRLFTGA